MDKELANKFKLSRTLIDVGSSATLIFSAVLLIAPASRLVGATGLGASIAAFTATSYLERRYRNITDQHFQRLEVESRGALQQAEQNNHNLKGELDQLRSASRHVELAYSIQQKALQQLKDEMNLVESDRQSLQAQAAALSVQTDQLKGLEASLMASTKKSVQEAVEDWRTRLTQTLASRRIADELPHRVEDWKGELADLYQHWHDQIDEIPDDLHQYLEVWAILHGATQDFSNLKTRIINSSRTLEGKASAEHIQRLEAELEVMRSADLIPKSELQKVIGNCQAQLAEFRSSLQDHTRSTLEFAEALEAEVLNEQDPFILKLRSIISDLTSQLEEALKPHRFPGSFEQSRIGNAIIDYYYQAGITLDGMDWVETETGYKLRFYCDRNGSRFISNDLLNGNEASEKLKHLTSALNAPQFARDERSCHLVLDVQTRRPRKKEVSEVDIYKLMKPASEFEKIVAGWERVRITGGSKSGKSPTAENLAVVLVNQSPGVVRLFNPQHDSVKNHWSIPVDGQSHKESEEGISELYKKLDDRASGKEPKTPFELHVFDEIDSTMSHSKSPRKIASEVNFIIKQSSHQNLGAIFIGQNANVSEYPGMSRSDWNSAVNIHIGSNAYDAISNSNLFTSKEVESLKTKANKLEEYCLARNEELGLGEYDPQAYRFALVIEPQKRPYFIELPNFGCYQYDQNYSVNTLSLDQHQAPVGADFQTNSQKQSELEPSHNRDCKNNNLQQQLPKGGLCCPTCNSNSFHKAGKNGSKQRYQCKECKTTWSN